MPRPSKTNVLRETFLVPTDSPARRALAFVTPYSDKQRDWARAGALIGTGTAAALLLVAYVRQT